MTRVFISYSHQDEDWKDRVVSQLDVLANEGLKVWDDRRISGGDNWYEEIKTALEQCDIALLLISRHFLTSQFILKDEVPELLKRRETQGIRVIPVILSPCQWQRKMWLQPIQARPVDGESLSGMSDHDAENALSELAGEIYDIAFAAESQKNTANKTSPYIAGPAVTPPDFVGRRYELRALDSALLRGESYSIIGNRRIGKSSILATLLLELKEDGRVIISLDGQNGEGASFQAFLQAIVQHPVAADVSADEAGDQLVQWASQQRQSQGKHPLILVDECEAIIRHGPPRFWERVRGALGQIQWVFSSRLPIDQLYKSYHHESSPFENQLKPLWIGLLDEAAAEQLITKGGFSDPQQQLMRRWAGRHPFFLQLLGDELWLAQPAFDQQPVLDTFRMSAQRHLDDIWRHLSKSQKNALLDDIRSDKAVDDFALRSLGVITSDGVPFAEVFAAYLRDKANE